MANNWTVIILTGANDSDLKVLEQETNDLKIKGCISQDTEILGVQDPSENVGSGAATLNALYTGTEYLSALNGFATFNTDVLLKSKILILHCGRKNVFDSGNLKALTMINTGDRDNSSCSKAQNYGLEPVKNLEHLIHLVTNLSRKADGNDQHSEVWVCSTDMSFHFHKVASVTNFDKTFPTIFTVNSDIDYASKHGTVCSNKKNFVENIIYCGTKDIIQKYQNESSNVDIVCGIVYLPINVAENMLIFNSLSPLNRCTYMGIDGGGEPLQVSLFFDILVAMALKVTKEDFIGGHCGKLYNVKLSNNQRDAITRARSIIWSYLNKFQLKAIKVENCEHIYWDDRLNSREHVKNLLKFNEEMYNWSYTDPKFCGNPHDNICIVNSYIKSTQISVGKNTAICHCFLSTKDTSIGENCYLCGVDLKNDKNLISFCIPNDTAIIGFNLKEFKDKLYVVLGINDTPHELIHKLMLRSNQNGSNVLEILTKNHVNLENEPLENCKIFPSSVSLKKYLEVINGTRMEIAINNEQLCLREILDKVDLENEQKWKMTIRKKVCFSILQDVLNNNSDCSILNYFKIANTEGWAEEMLEILEETALSVTGEYYKLCRILSSIADLLGTMAGNLGKIRSGPGNNKCWESSFSYLKQGDIILGLKALKNQREKWMTRNDTIVRAARHYERALQILIQKAVMSVKDFIEAKPVNIPPADDWVIVECPARADLQGGWTDTPPICYEQGGSVVGVSLMVDGARPIGAKARRIEELKLSFHLIPFQGNIPEIINITSVKDLLDYNEPSAPGALLKAAVIVADIISLTSNNTLQEQLSLNSLKSGIELHIWSNLPQGSGLGTSSILAGAVISALWTVTGKSYTKSSILHAVLYLEQLMTTGGGWQDQIGGIMGGINRGFSLPKLPLQIQVDKIVISENIIKILNEHLLLIYTGKVRLAKNLLQNVIRNWYAREEKIVKCFQELLIHSKSMASALPEGNLSKVGQEMNCYWEIKKELAPGCDPLIIRQLMQILEPDTCGRLLVGAGGGGFMCIVTKKPCDKDNIEALVNKSGFSETVTVHSIKIDMAGITIKIGNDTLELNE